MRKGDVYNNTFTYSIGYRNGWPSYATSISVDISINSGGRWVCQDDGVWCVTYSGWGKSDGVMVKYAGVELEHGGPTFRVPMEGAPRDDYFYEDCVPW
ncbi:hypothetical protein BGW39_003188 [Mortierella sp. 14UC]|nr:hypothetical protein BGW39_003188 [Mortierella sp. 14UC]